MSSLSQVLEAPLMKRSAEEKGVLWLIMYHSLATESAEKPDLAEWLPTSLGLQKVAEVPLCGLDLLAVFLLPVFPLSLAGVKASA